MSQRKQSDALVHHERALVGLCIIDPSTIDRIDIELASYSPWMDEASYAAWNLMLERRAAGEPINATTFPNRGEAARLIRDAAMVGQEAYHLAKLTRETELRKLRKIAQSILEQTNDEKSDTDAIASQAIDAIQRVPSTASQLSRNAGDIMRDVIELSRTPKPTTKIETGLVDLDNVIGGFRPGQLIILAARPSIGKSALASQFAIDAAKDGHGVLFVSLEMTATETIARAIAYETGLPMADVLDGKLDADNIKRGEVLASHYQRIPLSIADKRGLTVERIASLVRRSAASDKLGLVVVDYLGLVTPVDRRKPRWESITEISNGLKTLAMSESLPVVALCQLNRESEGESPKLSHLRESGSIEQDADIVLLLHREKRSDEIATLFVAKNRNGPIQKIELEYEARKFKFMTRFGDFASDFR